jgi:hypothetical protein
VTALTICTGSNGRAAVCVRDAAKGNVTKRATKIARHQGLTGRVRVRLVGVEGKA